MAATKMQLRNEKWYSEQKKLQEIFAKASTETRGKLRPVSTIPLPFRRSR